jgi:hypothetical protein
MIFQEAKVQVDLDFLVFVLIFMFLSICRVARNQLLAFSE